jgi:putative DNA primase/helicase
MGQEYRRAMLAGARLNVVNEFPEADILDSTAVKAILDGNKIVGRFIKEAPFSYRPVAGHAFAANDLPAVRDLSRGFWRRWLVLEFGFEFKEENAERDIAKKVIANERALIASWAIEGAAALIARGHYAEPLSAKRALAAWRYGVDVVMRFAEERCTKTESADTSAASLYNAFIGFCQNAGHRQLSSTKFGLRLSRLGIEKKKKRDGIFYALALRLRVVNGGDNG